MCVRAIILACAAATLACVGVPTAPPAVPASLAPGGISGEVIFVASGSIGNGATFDDRSVKGPAVNMAATPEGVWGGDLRGRNFLLELSEGRIEAAALELQVDRTGDALQLGGVFGSRRVRVLLSPSRFHGSVEGGGCSFDLAAKSPGRYEGFVSCPPLRGRGLPIVASASLRLTGEAARLDQPVLPQMVLALLAVLPP